MHLREAMGPPVLVIACAGRDGQLAGRALACAPLDRLGLGGAPTRSQTRTLTAADAVPAVANVLTRANTWRARWVMDRRAHRSPEVHQGPSRPRAQPGGAVGLAELRVF
jgi:hypothetical protein